MKFQLAAESGFEGKLEIAWQSASLSFQPTTSNPQDPISVVRVQETNNTNFNFTDTSVPLPPSAGASPGLSGLATFFIVIVCFAATFVAANFGYRYFKNRKRMRSNYVKAQNSPHQSFEDFVQLTDIHSRKDGSYVPRDDFLSSP